MSAIVLHRDGRGRYWFETPAGRRLDVVRTTDGTLGSVVIWDVRHPGQVEPIVHFQSLADLRRYDWAFLDLRMTTTT